LIKSVAPNGAKQTYFLLNYSLGHWVFWRRRRKNVPKRGRCRVPHFNRGVRRRRRKRVPKRGHRVFWRR